MGKREREREQLEQLHAQQIAARDNELAQAKLENERLIKESEMLAQRVKALEDKESAVLDAIIQARKTAAETVAEAQRKAKEIIGDASEVTAQAREISENARSIIKQAQDQAAQITADADREAASALAKANERAAYILAEARGMSDDHQSLLDNMRERMHTLLSVSIDNIRDFAAKMAALYEEVPADLEPLLKDSIRDIELHLRQIGAPPREDGAPSLGYTDAQQLVHALQRLHTRSAGKAEAAPRAEERVWTVDEVMQKSGEQQADGFERLSDTLERVDGERAVPQPQKLGQPPYAYDYKAAPRAPHLPPSMAEDTDLGAEEGLV